MKTCKIYKYSKNSKVHIQEPLALQKPFVIEMDGEMLRTPSGALCRFSTHQDAENRLMTVLNKKITEVKAM